MLKYKILIKLFVLNSVREGCSSAVYIVLPFKQCAVNAPAGLSVLKKKKTQHHTVWVVIRYKQHLNSPHSRSLAQIISSVFYVLTYILNLTLKT